MHLSLPAQIEALLLYEGEALSIATIAKTLKTDKDTVVSALAELKNQLEHRGVMLIENGSTYMLATHPEMQPVFAQLRKDELERELSKSALETLTVIAYRGPVAKHDIDYIRGVNSYFSLRNLLVRGLIEKIEHADTITYRLSTDTLSYLGIGSASELPDFEHVNAECARIITNETTTSASTSASS